MNGMNGSYNFHIRLCRKDPKGNPVITNYYVNQNVYEKVLKIVENKNEVIQDERDYKRSEETRKNLQKRCEMLSEEIAELKEKIAATKKGGRQ